MIETNYMISFDDNPEFNQEFDNLNTGITVGDIFLAPSWLLYNTDYELYMGLIEDFHNRQFQELKQSIHDSFPSTIAYNYRLSEKGAGADDPVRKLLHLKDT